MTEAEAAARPRPPLATALAALVVVAAIIAATAWLTRDRAGPVVAKDGRFTGHGVSLDYPPGWDAGPTLFLAESATADWSESFVPFDGPQGVSVTAYRLTDDVTPASVEQAHAKLEALVEDLATDQRGRVTDQLAPVTVGGIDGYHASFTAFVNGVEMTDDLTMLFFGDRQWNIQCQYDERGASAVTSGCRKVKASFVVDPGALDD
jgi:hypothetical protein